MSDCTQPCMCPSCYVCPHGISYSTTCDLCELIEDKVMREARLGAYPDEIVKAAQSVIDGRPVSYVKVARLLSNYILKK